MDRVRVNLIQNGPIQKATINPMVTEFQVPAEEKYKHDIKWMI